MNRPYDQKSGRWTQEDPVGIAGGINLFQFNGNNPVAHTDPFGLCKPWPDCWFQAIANFGASRGGTLGTFALNTGAALNAASEALGTNELGAAIGEGDAVGTGVALASMLPTGRVARAGKALQALDDLSTAARALDRGGYTRAGRALTKHASGQRGASPFPALSGTADDINRTAQNIVDDILTNPASRRFELQSGRFRGGVDIVDPSGKGVRYDAEGNFITFVTY